MTQASSPEPSQESADEPYDWTPPPEAWAVVTGLLGFLLVLVSLLFTWGRESIFGDDRNALNLTSNIYFDTTPPTLDGSPIARHLVVCLVLIVLGLWVAKVPRFVAAIGGAGAILVVALFLNGVRGVLADDLYRIDGGVTEHVGLGVWLCLVGGIAVVISALPIGENR